jgi:Flp pilus assembly protein TadD
VAVYSAEGHAQMGWNQMFYEWDFRGAEASFARALELAPGNATALRRAGVLAMNLGRLEDAITLYRRAIEQDPLSASNYHNLGLALHAADRFAEAEAAYCKALELAPQRVIAHAWLSVALLAQAKGEEAVAEALREPHESFRPWALAIIHHALGHRPESDAALDQLRDKHAEIGPVRSQRCTEREEKRTPRSSGSKEPTFNAMVVSPE